MGRARTVDEGAGARTEGERAGIFGAVLMGAAGAPTPPLIAAALTELSGAAIGPEAALALGGELLYAPAPSLAGGYGEATYAQVMDELILRSLFAFNAAGRLAGAVAGAGAVAEAKEASGGDDDGALGAQLERERRYLDLHLRASGRRVLAANDADRAARLWGNTLGWHAVLDSRTTPTCRRYHGNNFRLTSPPPEGLPGTLHAGRCRCIPGPPWPRGRKL